MGLTLNQIVSRIETLALSHKQINHFYFGDPAEFDVNGEIQYPACFCEQTPGAIDRVRREQRFGFRLYFLDLVPVATDSEENETEVISDMSEVAADMMAMLNASEYQDDWIISDTNNFISVTEALNDMDAGVILDVTIAVEFLADRCQVPAEDVTFETDFDMAQTRLFKYTADGSEGDSFTPTDDDTGVTLGNKLILAIYRAGDYKRPVITLPTDTDHVQVVGSVAANRKGILSTTGAVGLQTGDTLISGEVLDFLIHE